MDYLYICRGVGFCDFIPSSWLWIRPLVMATVFLIVIGVPISQILHRAGRSRWWTILAFVPLLNLISLWVFAFTRWPNLDR